MVDPVMRQLEAGRHALTEAAAAAEIAPRRDAGLRAVRQVLVRQCLDVLGDASRGPASLGDVIELATAAEARPARRVCAALIAYALAIRGVVPTASGAQACRLAEMGLRDVLLRCGYPFGGSVAERLAALERLHGSLAELMQPLEPTFPNWQGLYAG